MAIRVRVRNNEQIIVPIRFARAVTGAPQANAPDVDDRGFIMGPRTPSWGVSSARGAMVGIMQGDTVRVRVLREDIDAAAPLYVTSTRPAVADVAAPAGGGPLPADGIFEIRGVVDVRNQPVAIQVRLGSVDGPVLGELEPHIFRRRRRWVRAHLVTIDHVATNRTRDSLVAHFNSVNDIWRPCGIQFRYNRNHTRNEEIRGSQFRSWGGAWRPLPAPLGPAGSYATAGTVTTNLGGHDWREFSTLLQIRPSSTMINVYCVHAAPEFVGLTYDNDVARPNGYGVVIRDSASPYDTAHELGHFLNNDNHADANAAGTDPDYNAAGAPARYIWVVRRLMFSYYPPAAPPYRHDVGYGAGQYGALITVKNLPSEHWDNELARSRRRALNPY